MRFFRWISDNILFLCTLILLAFIPLYPKLPLLDVKNTWVYIRAEDFIVMLVLLLWFVQLVRKKITLKTPLTMPILIFWLVGALATLHGILVIFPAIANVFPNVAFLSYLRRVEYVSVFFIAYSAMNDKRLLPHVVVVLIVTFFLVFGYGIGQKYFGLPAYLTMNEEFAKGEAIRLSLLSRVPSTFAGHYDLAAYLVLVIPIFASLIFGTRSLIVRTVLFFAVFMGFILVFMTVSRVSFFVMVAALCAVLFFHMRKKRFILFSLPLLAFLAILFLSFSPTLLQRFGNTLQEVDVLVDAKTGQALGNLKIVPSSYFENKIIKRKDVTATLQSVIGSKKIESKESSPSAILPYTALPESVPLLLAANVSTGESLPQGTGYINLPLSPVTKRVSQFLYERSIDSGGVTYTEVLVFYGDFLIKKATAYDLSFTTRFQGEWPKAFAAFKRNIIFGSGYGSISLAVDNNYLRILGEIGLLGFASYIVIFVVSAIYMKRILPQVDSPFVKSFTFGFAAGIFGLFLNAVLIDVFEASKIAFILWLLMGVVIGVLHLYEIKRIDLFGEFKKLMTSSYAIIGYLFLIAIVVYAPMTRNFFVGDDFTWFRWVTECNSFSCIPRFFTDAGGFFYRPGPKIYFFLMYKLFWLNPAMYHAVSIFLHFAVTALLFLLAKKILRNVTLSFLAAFLFLILSGYSEAIFWISTTQFLFTALFMLSALLFFIAWEEKKKTVYFAATLLSLILSLLFHELGVVAPLFLILYKVTQEPFRLSILKRIHYGLLFVPIIPYLLMRYFAHSHWFSGDYNYNLLKLPFNVLGNAVGYMLLAGIGPLSSPFYRILRLFLRDNIALALAVILVFVFVLFIILRFVMKRITYEEKRIVLFGLLFFVIALLPFLGLGNITSRYSYLASFGFILLFVFLIQKLYTHLLTNGKMIVLAGCAVVVGTYCLLQIIQVQKIHSDWYEAGEKSRKFFIAIDELYTDDWSKEPVEFHFVNVPIQHGDAWVFPVGLPDALWLILRNPNISVYQWPTIEEAQSALVEGKNQKVFEFTPKGSVIEKKKVIPTL